MRRALLSAAGVLALCAPAAAGELEEPFLLKAGGQPIDVGVGHAAPFVEDVDQDGVLDLLVGEFADGDVLFFRGTKTKAGRELLEGKPVTMRGGGNAAVPFG